MLGTVNSSKTLKKKKKTEDIDLLYFFNAPWVLFKLSRKLNLFKKIKFKIRKVRKLVTGLKYPMHKKGKIKNIERQIEIWNKKCSH